MERLIQRFCHGIINAEYRLHSGIPFEKPVCRRIALVGHIGLFVIILRELQSVFLQTAEEYLLSRPCVDVVISASEHTQLCQTVDIYKAVDGFTYAKLIVVVYDSLALDIRGDENFRYASEFLGIACAYDFLLAVAHTSEMDYQSVDIAKLVEAENGVVDCTV